MATDERSENDRIVEALRVKDAAIAAAIADRIAFWQRVGFRMPEDEERLRRILAAWGDFGFDLDARPGIEKASGEFAWMIRSAARSATQNKRLMGWGVSLLMFLGALADFLAHFVEVRKLFE